MESKPVETACGGVIERIDGDVQPIEARLPEGRGHFLEEPAVGRHGDIGHAQVPLQDADQFGHVAAQQGLAAGQADFLNAQGHECPRDAGQLGEAHELRVAQERIARAEHLPRHAVGAPEVAPVGHRDAQVVQPAVELV